MACWVHVRDNGEAVDARSIRELEREWLQKDDEDDLGLDVTGLERDYWLGTEAGLDATHSMDNMRGVMAPSIRVRWVRDAAYKGTHGVN